MKKRPSHNQLLFVKHVMLNHRFSEIQVDTLCLETKFSQSIRAGKDYSFQYNLLKIIAEVEIS